MAKHFKKNHGGIAIVLLWNIVFFIIVISSMFVVDMYYANVKAEIAKDALTMSAFSIYKDIDRSQLDGGNVTLNERSIETFKTYLAKNMKLNNDLTAKYNSIAVGKVSIEDLIIYNKDNSLQYYPDGNKINYKPSLYVKIKFDIEPLLKGIVGGNKTVYTSATVDLITD